MNLYFVIGEIYSFHLIIQSFSPAQRVAIMSHTHFHDCAITICASVSRFSGSSFIFLVCGAYHHLELRQFSLSSGNPSPHSSFHRRKGWHATYFPQSFHTGKAGPSAPISSWPYCTFSCGIRPTSHLFVFSKGKWCHRLDFPCLDFSIVCCVHDQFSLPKVNTAYTWFTTR